MATPEWTNPLGHMDITKGLIMIIAIIFAALAYLLGSVCTAVLVCKFMGLPDPTTEGSKNPGATNVLRIGGKNAAIIVLVADALKGFLPVFIAKIFGVEGFGLGIVVLAATLGHIFPLFYGFKGGKGVATAIGGTAGLSLIVGIVCAATWFGIAYSMRLASLASLVAVGIAPLLLLFLSNSAYFIPMVFVAGIIVWRHWDNIQRLKTGSESKMEF